MTHYKENNDPFACLVGNCLKGDRNKSSPPKNNMIKIKSFYCELEICPDNTCRQMAQKQLGRYRLNLHENINDSMSGMRGIIQPSCGYDGPDFISDKKPKKSTKHNPSFKLNMSEDCPAVCYFDSLQTQTISTQVQLNRVQIKN